MDKYGLIGYPLGHSFSKTYWDEKFQSEGTNATYTNFEIQSITELREVLATNPELRGLNVTIPYKQQVLPFLNDISPEAQAIGAVNVIKVSHQGTKTILKGFNSDVVGFTESIRSMLDSNHKKALILGTGGSSKAVKYGLEQLGLQTKYVSRTPREGQFTYDDITPEIVREYTVIVNCTPLGMYPNVSQCPPLPYEALDGRNLLYDLIYNPDETTFLANGKQHGAVTKNGLEMLLLQAFASWDMWHE